MVKITLYTRQTTPRRTSSSVSFSLNSRGPKYAMWTANNTLEPASLLPVLDERAVAETQARLCARDGPLSHYGISKPPTKETVEAAMMCHISQLPAFVMVAEAELGPGFCFCSMRANRQGARRTIERALHLLRCYSHADYLNSAAFVRNVARLMMNTSEEILTFAAQSRWLIERPAHILSLIHI